MIAQTLVVYSSGGSHSTSTTGNGAAPAGSTTRLSLAAASYAGVTLNLLDTPGHPDFAGAQQAALNACDTVLFVVSATGGVDARTAQLWEQCTEAGLPRAVAVTQLDRDGADFDETVALCQRLFGEDVNPLVLPLHADDETVAGLIDLLTQRVHDWSTGQRVDRDADPAHLPLIDTLRSELIEAITAESEDDELLDHYLDGDELDPALLVAELHTAVAGGQVSPVLAVTPALGAAELLELLTGLPVQRSAPAVTHLDGSPAAPLSGDPTGPLVAEVVWGGPDHLLRVFSGALTPSAVVQISGGGTAQVGALHAPDGALTECRAGDLCVTALTPAHTGDTLSDPANPLVITGRQWPEPHHPVALAAARPDEQERLAEELARLVADDPSARVEHSAAGQLLLWAVGDVHAEALIDQLSVAVIQPVVRVAPHSLSEVEIRVPPWAAGAVADDLARRRGRVTGRESTEDGTVIRAEVPDAELVRYALRLREISRGTGMLRRRALDVVREL